MQKSSVYQTSEKFQKDLRRRPLNNDETAAASDSRPQIGLLGHVGQHCSCGVLYVMLYSARAFPEALRVAALFRITLTACSLIHRILSCISSSRERRKALNFTLFMSERCSCASGCFGIGSDGVIVPRSTYSDPFYHQSSVKEDIDLVNR